MTATEEYILDWLKKAEHDLKSARILIAADEDLNDAVCFHSQQLVEKVLKALLIARNIEFTKTHNLLLLSNLLHDEDLIEHNQALEKLSTYAVESRYPGDYIEPERGEATEALQIAISIYELAMLKLGIRMKPTI